MMRADRLWLLAVMLAAGCTPERVPVTSEVAIPDDDEPAMTSTTRQPAPEAEPEAEPEPEPEPAPAPAPALAAEEEPPWPPPMPAIDNIRDPETARQQTAPATTIIIVPMPSAPRQSGTPAAGVGAVIGDSTVVDPTPAPTTDSVPGTQLDPGVPPVPGAPRNSALPPASRGMPGVPPPGTGR